MNESNKFHILDNTDEKDLDCFGNYDAKQIDTCHRCGQKIHCEKVTKEMGNQYERMRNFIKEGKQEIVSDSPVQKTIDALVKKSKAEKPEKKMSKDEKKKEKKSEKSEKSEKKVKSSESEKSEKSEKKTSGTKEWLPKKFKSLVEKVSSLGTVITKASVINFKGDNGIMFCIPKSAAHDDEITFFLNRSIGYTGFKGKSKNVKIKEHSKGNLQLIVDDSDDAKNEVLSLLKKWVADYSKFVSSDEAKKAAASKTGAKPKKKDDEDEEEETPKKKKKKEDDDDDEGETPKKKLKKVKSKKKDEEEEESSDEDED